MMRCRLAVVALVALLAGACAAHPPTVPAPQTQAPPVQTPPAADATEKLRASFQKALEEYDRQAPRAFPCNRGFHASRSGYVSHVAEWAARAGLARGDRITRLTEPSASSQTFSVTVERDRRALTIPLPCRPDTERWTTTRALLKAGSEGQWDDCDTAARRLIADAGFSTAAWTFYRLQCRKAGQKLTAGDEQQLVYDIGRLIIAESSVTPGELDSVRGTVLRYIAALKNARAHTYADDLERQLAAATRGGRPAPRPGDPRVGVSRGTGFIVRPNGLLVTAHHVVRNAKAILVKCADRDAIAATVVTAAAGNDLAVLRIAASDLPFLPIARARSVRVGDPVFTIGFPAAPILGSEPKFTEGSVSSLSGPGGEAMLMQISVPIQPGNSGGPLVSETGDVVGIVSSTAAIQPFLAATGTLPQNVNWAVKSEYMRPLFDEPEPLPPATGRRDAIDRALRATCAIEARP